MSLSVMLQVLALTSLTVAFPFRMWLVMLASADLGEQTRRQREMREAIIFRDVRAELFATIPVVLEPPAPPGGGLA
jgi:hypothetical protein